MKKPKTISYDQALHKAAAYCSMSEKSVFDVQEKLHAWGAKTEDHEKIISYLIEEKFLDEERFAIAYVKDKFRYNKWGKIKIRIMLQQKKIPQKHIETALSEIDDKAYQDMLIKLKNDKERNLKYKDEYDKKAKLVRYLTGKGFEMDMVINLLNC